MANVILQDGDLRVEIDPALGAGLVDLSLTIPGRGPVPLMRTAPATGWFNDLASYLLIPWSNRISLGQFAWEGRTHRLATDWPDGTAIHGLVKEAPWRIEQRSPVSALLKFSSGELGAPYPWPFSASVLYRIDGSSVATRITLTHEVGGSIPGTMPAGLGFHPFWKRSLWDPGDAVRVHAPGLRRYPCLNMIPVGTPELDAVSAALGDGMPLDSLTLDDVFAGSLDGSHIRWDRSGVRVTYECSPELGHAVLFTGAPDPRGEMPGFFCLEPVTMVNDGFNLASRGWIDTGVRALEPGESMLANWTIRIDRD